MHLYLCVFFRLGMLNKWEEMEEKFDESEKIHTLHRCIKELRDQLFDIKTKMPNMVYHLQDKRELENNIQVLRVSIKAYSTLVRLRRNCVVKARNC